MRKRISLILWWENIPIYFFDYYKTHTHICFSVKLAGILRVGKKHFLGNLAVRFVCRMRSTFAMSSHSACAQRIPIIFFAGKHQLPSQTGPLPHIDFLCKPDFARGQSPADDKCVY